MRNMIIEKNKTISRAHWVKLWWTIVAIVSIFQVYVNSWSPERIGWGSDSQTESVKPSLMLSWLLITQLNSKLGSQTSPKSFVTILGFRISLVLTHICSGFFALDLACLSRETWLSICHSVLVTVATWHEGSQWLRRGVYSISKSMLHKCHL